MAITDKQEEIAVCKWCGKKLGSEYYFKCKNCGITFCYIHRNKHKCKIENKKKKKIKFKNIE